MTTQIIERKLKRVILLIGIASFVLIAGCEDIRYAYDVPENVASCPDAMDLRDGGSEVIDRDGGSEIVDRDGNHVTKYCTRPCAAGTETGDPEVTWHQDGHKVLVAQRKCTAPSP